MKTIAHALLWEMSRHWYHLLIGFLVGATIPFFALFSLSSLGMPFDAPEMIRIHAFLLPFHFLFLSLGIIGMQGPIQRLYGLPLSNTAIACWNMASGIFLVSAGVAGLIFWLNVQLNADWPVLGPTLYSAMAFAILQPWFRTACRTTSQVAVMPVLVVLLSIGFLSRYTAFTKVPFLWNDPTSVELLVMVGMALASTAVFVRVVALDRHGEDKTDQFVKWVNAFVERFFLFRSERSLSKLTNSTAAHAWYAWILTGRAYPIIVTGLMILGVIVCFCQSEFDTTAFKPDPRLRLELIMALLWTTLFAFVIGPSYGMLCLREIPMRRAATLEETVRNLNLFEMGSFIPSLPIKNEQIARAILLTAAKSSLIAAAVLLSAFGLVSLFKTDLVSGLWQSSFAGWYWIGLLVLPWTAMCCTATVCSLGRGRIVVGSIVAVIVLIPLIGISTTQSASILSLSILSTAILLLAIAIGYKSGNLSAVTIVWSIVAGCVLFSLLYYLNPLEYSVVVICSMLLFSTAAVLPIVVMPVAIAFNRHR